MAAADDRGRVVRLIRAIFSTFAPERADASGGVELMLRALDALAPHRRARLQPLLALLAAAGFANWPLARREALMRACADAPVPALRSGFQALKRLALFAAYGTMDDRGGNPLWQTLGYGGPRADRPPYATVAEVQQGALGVLRADAVVIGSGAGGGVAAALLARAGLDVIVLEAGPPADAAAAAQSEARAMAELYLDAGLAASDDLGIAILAGACVGGGTAVNWSTSLRLTEPVAAQWAAASGVRALGEELGASYDAVAARLGLTPAATHNGNNRAILEGCTALGWEARPIPRNASCCGDACGYCGFGCAYGEKRGTATTYLRDAAAAGARIIAGVRVDRVRIEGGRAAGVEADGLRVDAPLVVVAAGALRTPGILARSGVRSPHLGRHLRLHPTSALAATFDTPVESWHGPMQSILCDRFAALDDAYGATIETAPAHPGLMALALPWRSRAQHEDEMARARHTATLIALTRDRGAGTVSLDGRDDVRYALAPDDAAHLLTGLVRAAEMAFAAGATRVTTLHAQPVILDRADASRGGLERFEHTLRARGAAPNRLALFSAHQMGTARMHRDPHAGVVDERGALHGVEGVLVTDSSVFPLASGVNPMLTIMALADRTTRAALAARVAYA